MRTNSSADFTDAEVQKVQKLRRLYQRSLPAGPVRVEFQFLEALARAEQLGREVLRQHADADADDFRADVQALVWVLTNGHNLARGELIPRTRGECARMVGEG